MSHRIPHLRRWAIVVAAAMFAATFSAVAVAQMPPSPPLTVYGSVGDDAGVIPENVKVEAYIGETLCGSQGGTQFVGEGSARVTVYWVVVVSAEQTRGCGTANAEIRIKIGDRFAPQTARWLGAGVSHVDITFGSATPAPIPTATPSPVTTRVPTSISQSTQNGTPVASATKQPAGTIPAGSPGRDRRSRPRRAVLPARPLPTVAAAVAVAADSRCGAWPCSWLAESPCLAAPWDTQCRARTRTTRRTIRFRPIRPTLSNPSRRAAPAID